jgi:hypothetical protein
VVGGEEDATAVKSTGGATAARRVDAAEALHTQ